MSSRIFVVVLLVPAGLFLPSLPSIAQGIWWDIGSGSRVTITCQVDPASAVEFPPYPFGDYWPPGTLVYTELTQASHPEFVAVYSSYFNDGGCGCGGYLVRPCTFRFHYEDTNLPRPETQLRLYREELSRWALEESSTLDVQANTLTLARSGRILGTLRFAIGFTTPAPVEAATWGLIKSLYDR